MWQRAETGAANDAFRQILSECEDYAPTLDDLMQRLPRPNRYMWVWQSQDYRLALCYRVSDDRSHCHIIIGVPSPEGEPAQWCKTMIRKLRTELDALGVAEWSAGQLDQYQSEHMADFADQIDRVCHEVEDDIVENGRRKLRFRRRSDRKHLDTKYEGPGKDRPTRIKPRRGRR